MKKHHVFTAQELADLAMEGDQTVYLDFAADTKYFMRVAIDNENHDNGALYVDDRYCLDGKSLVGTVLNGVIFIRGGGSLHLTEESFSVYGRYADVFYIECLKFAFRDYYGDQEDYEEYEEAIEDCITGDCKKDIKDIASCADSYDDQQSIYDIANRHFDEHFWKECETPENWDSCASCKTLPISSTPGWMTLKKMKRTRER